ncbi:MAG: HD-GYP domain-containing protein [Fusicatenibacter sp.]
MEKGSDRKFHMLHYSLTEQLVHGMEVSNLAWDVAGELGLPDDVRRELAIAGVLHDIGKIPLSDYVEEQNTLVVEEMRFVRMHSELGYELLKGKGFSDFILDCIHYHHENYDGTGYPSNISGESIPYGARILRICDVYCALTSDRPYRKAFERDVAMELMVEEIKNFDIRMFLAFQRAVHNRPQKTVALENIDELIREIVMERN